MRTICDTNILIFWSQAPERMSRAAAQRVEAGISGKNLACSDISLWEIAMLFAAKRLVKPVAPEQFMRDLIKGMELTVLPITPEIAVLSQSGAVVHKDPADRLVTATAIHHRLPLLTSDAKLRAVDNLETIW